MCEWNFYLHTVSRSRYINSYIISKNVQEITIICLQTKTHIKINGLWIIHCGVLSTNGTHLIWNIQKKCKLQQSGLQVLIPWHSNYYKISLPQCVYLLQNLIGFFITSRCIVWITFQKQQLHIRNVINKKYVYKNFHRIKKVLKETKFVITSVPILHFRI